MNRRDFLKGAIILPNLLSLLPVLAKAKPSPTPIVPCAFAEGDEFVILNEIEVEQAGRGPMVTHLGYRGTHESIRKLGLLVARRYEQNGALLHMTCDQTVETIYNEIGEPQCVITYDWIRLSVTLLGWWVANLGIVSAGQTGISGRITDERWELPGAAS